MDTGRPVEDNIDLLDSEDADDPDSYFRCNHLRAVIRRGTCVSRQAAKWDKGGPVHRYCADGRCEQGNLVKLGLGKFTPAKYNDLRPDWRAQRKAKLAKARVSHSGV